MKLRFWNKNPEEENKEVPDGYFKPFYGTYRIVSMFMACGFIYPNPKTDRARLTLALTFLITSSPIVTMIVLDSFVSFLNKDFINMIRHSTVVGPYMAGGLKILLMFYKRESAKKIIDDMSYDYECYNSYPQDYKKIAYKSIEETKFYREKGWCFCVIICVMVFPGVSIALMLYNFIFLDEPQKFMIHDFHVPFMEEADKFKSPLFEFLFVYSFFAVCMYVVNFSGYDGFYGLVMNHGILKLTMYCKQLEDAFNMETDDETLRQKVVQVIKDQKRFYRYVDLVQETFENWLGLIFVATMIQICTCMYQVIEGVGFDLRYAVFVSGSVAHIYLPCYYGAQIKFASVDTSTAFYLAGWQKTNNQSIRKMILFMIARSQIACDIKAFNMVSFDMELFLSILQTSYSMFTLLRS